MKHLSIIIFFFASLNLFAQNTYVPDDNFEQALIDLGYDDVLDDYILTVNISGLTTLNLNSKNINIINGIEDFVSLNSFDCSNNHLENLNISNNTALTVLVCRYNQISSIDISQNTELISFGCSNNQITNINLSQNTILENFDCNDNQLNTLDIRNGNNSNIGMFASANNPNLTCIFVDDVSWCETNWTIIDNTSTFVETEAECEGLAVDDIIKDSHLKIYPNPAKEKFSIQTSSKIETIKIFNVFSKLLKAYEYQDMYSVSDLASGVYLIYVQSYESSQISKLIID